MQVREEAERPRTPLVAFFSILLTARWRKNPRQAPSPPRTITWEPANQGDQRICFIQQTDHGLIRWRGFQVRKDLLLPPAGGAVTVQVVRKSGVGAPGHGSG